MRVFAEEVGGGGGPHWWCKIRTFFKCCPIRRSIPTKNVVQKMSKMFWCPKIVQIFVITIYIYKSSPACQMFSLTVRIYLQREMHIAISFTELCYIKHRVGKCVKFAITITNRLAKNCPRKYWVTDRSPNRIRTFPEVQNFGLRFTPLAH